MPNQGMETSKKQLYIPIGLSAFSVVAAFLSGAMWINSQMSSLRESIFLLSEKVTALSAEKFTAKDGLEVWKEIAELRTKIAVIDEKIGKLSQKGEK